MVETHGVVTDMPLEVKQQYDALEYHRKTLRAIELYESVGGRLQQHNENTRYFITLQIATVIANKWAACRAVPHDNASYDKFFKEKMSELGFSDVTATDIEYPDL